MKFCPKCGKKGITGEFCEECLADNVRSMLEFKEIIIKICPVCMTYHLHNRQIKFDDLSSVIKKIAKQNIRKDVRADIEPDIPEMEYRPGKKYDFEVRVSFSPKEEYSIPASIEMNRCRKCDKQSSQYFEGVLQLRKPNKEVIDFVRHDVLKNRLRGVFITKEKKEGSGIDFWLSSQRHLQRLGHSLQKRFGGILKINPRIYTRNRQTSRDVYRINVYFELLGYNTGDIVLAGGKLVKVTSTGKQVAGINIATGKRTSFSSKEKVKIIPIMTAEVIKVYPKIELMDPETYQPLIAENRKKLKIGEKVSMINYDGRVYII